jgi:hypothetical protein
LQQRLRDPGHPGRCIAALKEDHCRRKCELLMAEHFKGDLACISTPFSSHQLVASTKYSRFAASGWCQTGAMSWVLEEMENDHWCR